MSRNLVALVFGSVLPLRRPQRLFTRRRILIGAVSLLLLGTLALLFGGETLFGAAAHVAPPSPSGNAAQTQTAPVKPTGRRGNDQRHPMRAPSRVADAAQAASLFAPHSWHVEPPPAPPAPPLPPPPPTAPPLPYTFIGSYTSGDTTTYYLSRADRVVDAHVGDQLDGVYTFESADANQLVFNYLPLNIRQSLPSGGNP
jgi:hypothetical protein